MGPYALSGLEHAAAGVRSLQSGEPYADELKRVQGFSQHTADAHPWATTGGEIGGGVLGTAPAIAAAPAAFGAGTAALPARMAASMFSGAGIGGADSAVRSGGDATETLRGAGVGAAFGTAAPVAGAAIGAGIRKFYDLIGGLRSANSGFSPAATRILGEDVANSGGIDAVRSRLNELGSPAMLLDASPSLQGQAQGLAVRPETREAVTAPIMARTAGTSDRLGQDVNAALGPAQSAPTATVDLRGQRMAPNQAIGAAVDGAPNPVSALPVLQAIDQRLPQARGSEEAVLRRARGMLAQEDPQTGWVNISNDPRVLHNVKQEMDTVINYGAPDMGVQPGAQTRKDSAAQMVRGQLNDLLRESVPGYGAANDASSALARQIDAVQAGSDLMRSGQGATAPADLARQLAGMAPAERAAMAQGSRAAIDQAVGTRPNDLTALQQLLQIDPRSGQGGWAAQNLAQLHGQDPVNRIVGAVNRERAFTDADSNIVRNSQTAQRTQAADRIAPRTTMGDDLGGTMAGLVGGPKGYALSQAARAGKAVINAMGRESDVARNRQLADAVTMTQGERLDALLAAIQARGVTQQRAAELGRLGARGTQAALLSQSDRTRPYFPAALPAFGR
ncbi:hypothetical protein [Methylobacterium mesophilicum]|uniref:hypothetical protein n=1 Tax=Methylobacterium mesophilicum TaxID=39956 RepID=UPI001FCF187E|nr:hypothetical protein [Methylobacterium mesophilicum]